MGILSEKYKVELKEDKKFNKSKQPDLIKQIIKIIDSTPNDQELGEKIRNLFK